MPALGSPATWRSHPQHHRGFLFLLKPTVVFKARVNQASFTYPLDQFTYDGVTVGTYPDVLSDMTLLVGSSDGADDLGRQRIRKAATSALLYPGWSSQGNHDGELDLADDAYITVLDDFRVWSKIPRILSDGTIYKDYDLVFGNYGTQYPPVANGGPGYAGFVDSVSELITVTLPPSGTSALNTQGSGTLTYLWDIADGTLTGGLLTDETITATFPAGFRWVHRTVTHSVTGLSHTCHIPVFAAETSGANKPFEHFVGEQSLRPDGQTFRLTILEDIPASSYPDGTLVMYWEEEYYSGAGVGSLAGPAGRQHMKFIGWIQRAPADIAREKEGLLRDTVLECVDVAGRLRSLPGFPQLLERAAAPTRWGQMDDPDLDRYIHYLLHWHSTALDLADFQWSGLGASTYPFLRLGSDGQSLYDQADQRAKAIGHRLTCDMWGRLDVVRDEMLADSRHSTNIVSLTEADYTSVRFERQRPPRVHWLRGYAVLVSETAISAVRCIAPGEAPGQGESSQEQNYQLVVDQDALNAREGHRYARLNAPEGLWEFELAHGGDAGINPAWFEWVPVTLGAAYAAQQGLTLSAARFLPQEVIISHWREKTGRGKSVRLRMEREVTGTPAQTVVIPPSPNLRTPRLPRQIYPRTVWRRITPGPRALHLHQGLKKMAAIGNDGYLYITTDFETPASAGGPTWIRTNLSLNGTPHSFTVNPFSPGYLGTGTSVDCFIATSTRIYKVADLFGTPVVTSLHTFAFATPALTERHLFASFGAFGASPPFIVCASYYQNTGGHPGTWTISSQDGGVTWGSEVQVTAHYNTGGSFQPGLYVSPKVAGKVYVGAFTSTGSAASAEDYVSTDYGASYALGSSPTISPDEMPITGIHFPWPDNPSELVAYYGHLDTPGGINVYRTKRVSGSTITDISPSDGTRTYGPNYDDFSVRTYDPDRRYVVMRAQGQTVAGSHYDGVWISDDYGDSWTTVVAPAPFTGSRPVQVAFAGDTPNAIYLWGTAGYIRYSSNFGATVEDKAGNIPASFGTIGMIIGIAGG